MTSHLPQHDRFVPTNMSARPNSSPALASHIPSLDGLRAFSVALVLIGHVAATHGAPAWMDRPIITSLGNIGVRFFFLISGFLITTLLLRKMDRHGRLHLRHFYIRRAYRILPAALTYIGLIWACHLAGWIDQRFHIASKTTVDSAIPDLIHALTFTANYNHDFNWYYNHLWSLSVEEQFYLIWPFALLYLGKAHGRWVCVATLVVCPIVRAAMYMWGDGPEISMNREFQAMSYGSALISRPFAYVVGQLLNWRSMAWIGPMSYSLYLWREPFLYFHAYTWITRFPANLAQIAKEAPHHAVTQPISP